MKSIQEQTLKVDKNLNSAIILDYATLNVITSLWDLRHKPRGDMAPVRVDELLGLLAGLTQGGHGSTVTHLVLYPNKKSQFPICELCGKILPKISHLLSIKGKDEDSSPLPQISCPLLFNGHSRYETS